MIFQAEMVYSCEKPFAECCRLPLRSPPNDDWTQWACEISSLPQLAMIAERMDQNVFINFRADPPKITFTNADEPD